MPTCEHNDQKKWIVKVISMITRRAKKVNFNFSKVWWTSKVFLLLTGNDPVARSYRFSVLLTCTRAKIRQKVDLPRHAALSMKRLDWVPKWCERWHFRTSPILEDNSVYFQLRIDQLSPLLLLCNAFPPITDESTFKALRGAPTREASGLDGLPAGLMLVSRWNQSSPGCAKYLTGLSLSLPLSSFWIVSFKIEKCLTWTGLQEQRWPLRSIVLPSDHPAS